MDMLVLDYYLDLLGSTFQNNYRKFRKENIHKSSFFFIALRINWRWLKQVDKLFLLMQSEPWTIFATFSPIIQVNFNILWIFNVK